MGPDVEIFENIPGLDLAVMADECRVIEKLALLANSEYEAKAYDQRRQTAHKTAEKFRNDRRVGLQSPSEIPGHVRPIALLDAVDSGLEKLGGGIITTEQFAVPLEDVLAKPSGGANTYIRPA